MTHTALETQHAAAIVSDPSVLSNASIHLSAVQIKQQIHESGICYLAIQMAQTGKRPIAKKDGESGDIEWQEMSEAAHVDMIKFMVKKVLPDAKEYDSSDDRKALDKWAAVIAAEG